MNGKPLLDSMGPAQDAAAPNSGDAEGAMRKISDGISDMIHGPAREQILQTFDQDASPKAAAAILYKPARQGIDQAEQAGLEVDIFSVATDGIDMLAEILEAMGKMGSDEKALEEFREETLMELMMLHAEQVGEDPEEQALAEQALAQYAEDGTLESTINDYEGRAKAKGIDPAQMRAQGEQMATPKQNPLAAGIKQGLQ